MDVNNPKPTKKLSVSKNRKKTWRKHIKGEEVEEFFVEKRREERTGGPLDLKPDEKIFFSDTKARPLKNAGGVRSRGSRLDRPIRSFQILISDSQIPPACTPCRKQRKSNRVRVSKKSTTITAQSAKIDFPQKTFDLWAPKVENTYDVMNDKDLENYYKEQVGLKGRKIPKTLHLKNSALPAVEVPAAGASYNPTYEDHQKLLLDAHSVEMKKKKEEERLKRRLTDKLPTILTAPTTESWIKEMSFGIIDDPDADNESDDAVRDGPLSINPPVRADKKKQLSKRRKLDALKKKEAELRRQKERIKKENEILRIRVIKKEVEKKEMKVAARDLKRKAKRSAKAYLPGKNSRHKYEAPPVDLNLTSELTGNLRQLKQEGSLLMDRYKSFQRRNVIDTRLKQTRSRKYKMKAYVANGYERLELPHQRRRKQFQ